MEGLEDETWRKRRNAPSAAARHLPSAAPHRSSSSSSTAHIKPLKRGGADRPNNMQWQTVAEASEGSLGVARGVWLLQFGRDDFLHSTSEDAALLALGGCPFIPVTSMRDLSTPSDSASAPMILARGPGGASHVPLRAEVRPSDIDSHPRSPTTHTPTAPNRVRRTNAVPIMRTTTDARRCRTQSLPG